MPLKHIIGIDIGGTKCAVSLGAVDDAAGNCEILRKMDFPTAEQGGAPSAVAKLLRTAYGYIRDSRGKGMRIDAIGISCGGPLDSKTGTILSPPNLPDWDDIHIKDIFYKEFNLPVKVQNDANACALAEWRYGAAKGYSDVIFLTFGTGMGAGLILGGRLYSGANDMAGEVGHIRLAEDGPVGYGKAGSFEGFCSGGGIPRLAAFLYPGDKRFESISTRKLAVLVAAGDESAAGVFKESGKYLGRGISTLIDILNPEMIVIGSIFERSGELLIPEMQKEIEREAVARSRGACVIVPAALGDKLGDYAAVAVGAY